MAASVKDALSFVTNLSSSPKFGDAFLLRHSEEKGDELSRERVFFNVSANYGRQGREVSLVLKYVKFAGKTYLALFLASVVVIAANIILTFTVTAAQEDETRLLGETVSGLKGVWVRLLNKRSRT